MTARSYQYRFTLSEKTVGLLRQLDEEGWTKLFTIVVENKPVPYNIDFSEFQPATRLCELYDIVETYDLDAEIYHSALVRLLMQYYGRLKYAETIDALIKAVDYSRPSLFYNRLQLLATKKEYLNMIGAVAGVEGHSVHFRLINAIMRFDTDRKLLQFLISLQGVEQPREYYQVTLRYLYSFCGQPEFNAFLDEVLPLLMDDARSEYVMKGFREYVHYQNEFQRLYNWFFANRSAFSGDPGKSAPFVKLGEAVMEWLQLQEKRLGGLKGYIGLRWLLSAIFAGGDEFSLADLRDLMVANEALFYDRNQLLELLGLQLLHIRLDWLGNGFSIIHGQQVCFVAGAYKAEAMYFEKGMNIRRNVPKGDLMIPDDALSRAIELSAAAGKYS